MGYVVADGKSNWLEGLILIGLYVVAAVTFWFYPGTENILLPPRPHANLIQVQTSLPLWPSVRHRSFNSA